MPISTSLIIPCRNKAEHVGRCLESALNQTVDDFEILISDQGSDDGSFEEICRVVREYKGCKNVRVLNCPETERRGMAGLSAHLNWLHERVNGALVIMCSADDYNHPQRVELTRDAFERHNPSYIGTRVQMVSDGIVNGETAIPDRMSRWIAPQECIKHLIGSSASSAWSRDLYEKYGPLIDIESQDLILPHMALLERGLYYLDVCLHTYEWHPSLDNTGMMGQQLAARTPEEKQQLDELAVFHMAYNWFAIMRRWAGAGAEEKLSADAKNALNEQALGCANQLTLHRAALSMQRIAPGEFRA